SDPTHPVGDVRTFGRLLRRLLPKGAAGPLSHRARLPHSVRERCRSSVHADDADHGVSDRLEVGSVRDVFERCLHLAGELGRRAGDVAADRADRRPSRGGPTHRPAFRGASHVRRRVRARAGAGRMSGERRRASAELQTARDGYEMVVGLEVHVQLKTATKIFCRCSTDFGAPPNANTCPVCLALPGALPVLNDHAVELAIRAALALGCEVQRTSIFARKNYFYPDLPKGYQISQFDRPVATRGRVRIDEDSRVIDVGITRAHLEEDAGKSIHDRFPGATAVDLNRAGVPLLEIVSEPDLRGSAAAAAYLRTLKQILEYIDVSDVSMEEGSLRVDANVSARRHGDPRLGTKTEVKNLNSFSAVARALEVEFARQCGLLERGLVVEQETMLWDEKAEDVKPARSKEASHDYRYFPEPDLPPLVIGRDRIERIQRS